jgi:hypothetical protein
MNQNGSVSQGATNTFPPTTVLHPFVPGPPEHFHQF